MPKTLLGGLPLSLENHRVYDLLFDLLPLKVTLCRTGFLHGTLMEFEAEIVEICFGLDVGSVFVAWNSAVKAPRAIDWFLVF